MIKSVGQYTFETEGFNVEQIPEEIKLRAMLGEKDAIAIIEIAIYGKEKDSFFDKIIRAVGFTGSTDKE